MVQRSHSGLLAPALKERRLYCPNGRVGLDEVQSAGITSGLSEGPVF